MFKFIPINIGRLDQILRLLISSLMIYAGFINKELIQDEFSSILLGIIGVVLMFTVILRSCPMYILVGWNTCRDEHAKCDKGNDNHSD
jgi:hypothetical protein